MTTLDRVLRVARGREGASCPSTPLGAVARDSLARMEFAWELEQEFGCGGDAPRPGLADRVKDLPPETPLAGLAAVIDA